ncbi:MAG: hypothetical protein ACFFCL_16640, partial [Promethearchaeota archaeon]
MEKPYQVEIPEEIEVEKEVSTSRNVLSWIRKNLNFIAVPGSTDEDLTNKVFEYEKSRSKRKMIRRFKSTLTILGIVLILIV